jgi:hypothetical protein
VQSATQASVILSKLHFLVLGDVVMATTSVTNNEQYNYDIIRKFTMMTLFWGAFGMLVGVYIASELAFPWLNFDIPYITFGRLRPVHTGAVIFGFGGSASQGNKIGNYFYNNNIGEYFYNNNITDNFYSNTIGNDFQLNEVKFGLNSVNFSLSTHVYANYNCTIFLRSDAQPRLSYYDSTDTLLITDVVS